MLDFPQSRAIFIALKNLLIYLVEYWLLVSAVCENGTRLCWSYWQKGERGTSTFILSLWHQIQCHEILDFINLILKSVVHHYWVGNRHCSFRETLSWYFTALNEFTVPLRCMCVCQSVCVCEFLIVMPECLREYYVNQFISGLCSFCFITILISYVLLFVYYIDLALALF